jgi:hypothetical protein
MSFLGTNSRGWRLPHRASIFLGSKAGNVVFFPGKHYLVAFLEHAEEDGDFFAGKGGFLKPAANFFMGQQLS